MKNIVLIALALMLCQNAVIYANDEESEDIEIDGLVLAQTRTNVGRDFHRLFMTMWTGPRGIQGYNIIIKENVSALNGKSIIIEVNDRAVFSNPIKTGSNDLKDIVKHSVDVLKDHLFMISIEGKSSSEDLSNSGL